MIVQEKKFTSFSILTLPVILVFLLGYFTANFYTLKTKQYLEKEKKKEISNYIKSKKSQTALKLNQIMLLCQESSKKIESSVKEELKSRVNLAYRVAHDIKGKYRKKKSKRELKNRVKDALFELVYNGEYDLIFVTDYNANSVVSGSHIENDNLVDYLDYDHRSIVYEEIQKVRRHGEGYITSRNLNKETEIIYVRDLEMYKWYIGSNKLIRKEQEKIKLDLLNSMNNIPLDKSEFLSIYENNTTLYRSEEFELTKKQLKKDALLHDDYQDGFHYLYKYSLEFNWTILYGFNIDSMNNKIELKYQGLQRKVEQVFENFMKILILVVGGIFLLSLLLLDQFNKVHRNTKV